MAKEWINVKEIGQLYVDKILVTFDVPLLFVCTDFENKKYLCLNVGEYNDEYVISETNNEYLINMLTNQITMEYTFRKSISDKIIIVKYDSENRKIISRVEDSEKASSELLPLKDAYFELSNKDISNYIESLKNQKHKYLY